MRQDTLKPVGGAPDGNGALLDGFLSSLAENLAGRRTLPSTFCGPEAEPATLAQLASMQRLQATLRRISARHDAVGDAAARVSDDIVAALVGELAIDPALRVASWPEAERVLTQACDLLNALDEALPVRPDAPGGTPPGSGSPRAVSG